MPRPDRSSNQAPQNYPRPPQGAPPQRPSASMQQQGMPSVGGVREDIRALNSSILLVTQKMKFLARNEKILGRNLVVLNKKIKNLEDKFSLAPKEDSSSSDVSSKEVSDLKQKIVLLEAQLEDLRSRTATTESLKELKYVIDSINPLEFATLSQVRDLIDKRLKSKEAP
jgi:predicted RNase H-like nuclease (RuvC/YqgF family)